MQRQLLLAFFADKPIKLNRITSGAKCWIIKFLLKGSIIVVENEYILYFNGGVIVYRLIIFQGPSGSGKSTLQNLLGIPRIVTWTTRSPRPNEVQGVDYNFVNIDEFRSMRENGQMLEVTEYKSNFYGTSLESFISLKNEVKSIIVDSSGAEKIKEIMDNKCFRIGVYAPRSDCKMRLSKRNQPEAELIKRLKDYEVEVEGLIGCDIIINNSDENWKKAEMVIHSLKSSFIQTGEKSKIILE